MFAREFGLVLVGDLELAAFFPDLVEEADIFDRNGCLVRKRPKQLDLFVVKRSCLHSSEENRS